MPYEDKTHKTAKKLIQKFQRQYTCSQNSNIVDADLANKDTCYQPVTCLIETLKRTNDVRQQSTLITCIEQQAINGHLQSQAFLANAYSRGIHGTTQSTNKALKFALLYAQTSFLVKDASQLPLERFHVKQILSRSVHHMIDNLYYQYFEALQNKNTLAAQEALLAFQNYYDQYESIRKAFLQSFMHQSNKPLVDLLNMEAKTNFEQMMEKFIKSEGTYFISLFENSAQHNKMNTEELYYPLGVLHYYKQQYDHAFMYLSQSSLYKHDLSTQCKVFQAYMNNHPFLTYKNVLQATDIVKAMFLLKKDTERNKKALPYSIDLLSRYATDLTEQLLRQHNYEKTIDIAHLCINNPQTYDKGLSILSAIHSKLVATNTNTTIIEPFLIKIKHHWNAHHDENSLACLGPIIAYKALTQKNIPAEKDAPLYKAALNYALHHNIYPKKRHTLEECYGTLLYDLSLQLSEKDEKIQTLRQAVMYHHHQALIDLSKLIFHINIIVIPNNEEAKEQINILNKLKDVAKNPHISGKIRIQALNFLYDLGYTMHFNNDNYLMYTPLTEETKVKYLKNAYELGCKKHLNTLAAYYLKGIKNKNTGEWIFPPNIEKSCELLEELLKKENTLKNRYELGLVYQTRGKDYFDKSYPLLQSMVEQHDPLLVKKKQQALFALCVMKLYNLTPDNIKQAYIYADQAKLLNTKESHRFLLLNDELYTSLSNYTKEIIAQQNTQPYALQACTFFGDIFYHHTYVDPAFDKDKEHAYACLQYAANHKYLQAQNIIVFNNTPSVDRWTKMIYIHNLMHCSKNIPADSLEQFIRLLGKYGPQDVSEKHEYLCYIMQGTMLNKQNYLNTYLQHFFTSTDTELAQHFAENDIFKNYITEFTQFYESMERTIAPMDTLNAIYMYAYALMNSDDKKLIFTSISYAQKLFALEEFKTNNFLNKILIAGYDKMIARETNATMLTLWHNKKEEQQKKFEEQIIKHVANTVVINEPLINIIKETPTLFADALLTTIAKRASKQTNK